MSATPPRRTAVRIAFGLGLLGLVAVVVLLRLTVVTDYLYHATVKDPERVAPAGRLIVAPADGTVLYVRRVEAGSIPEVVKRGVPVPLVDHLHAPVEQPLRGGWLVGIYMNTFGVHVNRIPDGGTLLRRHVYNGPHMDMTRAETKVILRSLIPGWLSLRKALGLHPYGFDDDADFILKSARETLVVEDVRGAHLYIVRIADYYVGKILTWVGEGDRVERGQRLGMISWGSQTDLFIEDTPAASDGGEELPVEIGVRVGQYVYGGETIIATY